MSLKALKDQYDALNREEDAILAAAEKAGGILTDEQIARCSAIDAERKSVSASIEVAERHAERQRKAPGTSIHAEPKTGQAGPFANLGLQMQAIARAGMPGGQRHEGLVWESFGGTNIMGGPSGSNEGIGSDGGFAIQQDLVPTMIGSMFDGQGAGELLSRITRFTVSENSNGTKLYGVDEKSRQNGQRFGGLQIGWIGEGDPFGSSKPKFREIDMPLRKLGGLWFATDELLADAAMLATYVPAMFQKEFTFVLEDGILNGSGVASPLGIFNSPALVQVQADTGQLTQTITQNNILNMWKRVPPSARMTGVWLVSQDAETQLYTMFTPVINGSSAVVAGIANPLVSFIPAGVNGSQYPLLMGKPVIVMEQMAPLGTSGDIMFCDLSSYFAIDKGGLDQASSIHVRFAYDEMAFRFIYRFNGQPAYSTPLTPFRGSQTISPFVTLAAR